MLVCKGCVSVQGATCGWVEGTRGCLHEGVCKGALQVNGGLCTSVCIACSYVQGWLGL